MMSQEQNDLITRTGPKDPCGKLMRMYWQPAALVDELTGPRPVKPVKLLGEESGAVSRRAGPLRPDRAALRASRRRSRVRPAGKWRPALRLPWLAVRRRRASAWKRRPSRRTRRCARASSSAPIPWSRRAASSGPISAKASRRHFPRSTASSRPTATPLRSRATSTATGCRRSRSASIRRMPRSCIASSRTRIPPRAYGKQFRGASAGSDMPMTKILREYDRPSSMSSTPNTACG